MKIGVIQASSQASKNSLIYNTVRKYAPEAEVINFGCTEEEQERYSYIEISLLAGMLLASGAVDFIVTGCSSGQGMMLACNSFPGVLCGYAPTPVDAYLPFPFPWEKNTPGPDRKTLRPPSPGSSRSPSARAGPRVKPPGSSGTRNC